MVADAVSESVLKNRPPGQNKPHTLRSVYVAIVDSVFARKFPKAGMTKRVLGHSMIEGFRLKRLAPLRKRATRSVQERRQLQIAYYSSSCSPPQRPIPICRPSGIARSSPVFPHLVISVQRIS